MSKEVIQFIHNQLRQAQEYACQGKFERAKRHYTNVIQYDLLSVFANSESTENWIVCNENNPLRINALALRLGEWAYTRQAWVFWLQMMDIIHKHPNYHTLDASERSYFCAITGFAEIINAHAHKPLPQILEEQTHHLNHLAPTDFHRALHYMVIGYVHTRLRNEKEAFDALHKADVLLAPLGQEVSYYRMYVRTFIGSIYYWLNQKRRSYYDKAIEIYKSIERDVREQNEGQDYTNQAYNIGWCYAELEEWNEAYWHFDRGLREHPYNSYRWALSQYGIGYVLSQTGDYDDAASCFYDALYVFNRQSLVMMAATLNLLATNFYKQGDLKSAIKRLEVALENLLEHDNPIQLHHVYKQLTKFYAEDGQTDRAKIMQARYKAIKEEYNMPDDD